MGKSLSPPIYTLSPFLKLLATIPSPILTEKYTSFIGPRISSTLPMTDLFCRYIGALKYGTLSAIKEEQSISSSTAWINEPISAFRNQHPAYPE
jgi:hypothetical protein